MSSNLLKTLILGSEFFTSKKAAELTASLNEPETHSWYAEDMEQDEFFSALFTPSLFSSCKLLTIKHAENIKKPEEFTRNIARTNNAAVILTSSELKKSAALQKAAKADGFEIFTEARKTGAAKASEIKTLFNEFGFKIDDSAANRIGLLTDWDLIKIRSEAEKLSLYFIGRMDVRSSEITNLINGQISETNFAFIDAFMERNRKKCLSIYPKLTETSSIFYMLTTYMAGIYFKITNRVLYSPSNPLFNGKDYFMRTVDKTAAAWKAEDAARVIDFMAELDLGVKTGRLNTADAVLLMVNKI